MKKCSKIEKSDQVFAILVISTIIICGCGLIADFSKSIKATIEQYSGVLDSEAEDFEAMQDAFDGLESYLRQNNNTDNAREEFLNQYLNSSDEDEKE